MYTKMIDLALSFQFSDNSRDRCFHLSVNECDCDVDFYCSVICQDEDKSCSYDYSTETCCCLDAGKSKFKNHFCNEPLP